MKRKILSYLGLGVLLLSAASIPAKTQEGIAIPAPIMEQTNITTGQQIAILAGGCFWGIQGVFQHVEGVTKAISGYAGGDETTAHYNAVINGNSGHAEAVKVIFDPEKISYGEILQIYFSVAHDPTQLNRQGPDYGPQYRSALFPVNENQGEIAKAYIQQLNEARVFDAAIVTKIEPDKIFYPAEDYHQDYMTRYPYQPYIIMNDLPKIDNLKRLFPAHFRQSPLLVAQTGI